MNYRTIIGGAFLAVTIAACTPVAVAAPQPSTAAPPARDQYYKDGAAAVTPANVPAAAQGPKTPLQSDTDVRIEAGPGK